MKMKMLTPLNWFGKQVLDPAYEPFDAAQFRRFLSKTLGFESKVSGDLRKIMTMIANFNATDAAKDEMVARIDVDKKPTELDWRDYR